MCSSFRHSETEGAVRSALARTKDAIARATALREAEMKADLNPHRLLWSALGVGASEAEDTDRFQNSGRILYARSGQIVNEMVVTCFRAVHPTAGKAWVPNPSEGAKPKRFEIDCLLPSGEAIEVKFRDSTTDGDHVNKEAARVAAIRNAGYIPVRLMLFEPERAGAHKIQKKVRLLYERHGGDYHAGPDAFSFLIRRTGIDLSALLREVGAAH